MNYELDKTKTIIIEKQTDHQIVKSSNTDGLKKLCRHLNLGGGFDGWTPAFFMLPTILVIK